MLLPLVAVLLLSPITAPRATAPPDACSRVAVATVGGVLRHAGLEAEHGSAESPNADMCMYSFAGARGGTTVMVSWSRLPSAQAARMLLASQGKSLPGAVEIGGLGDAAVVGGMGSGATLMVRRGADYVQVQVIHMGSAGTPVLTGIAREVGRLVLAGKGTGVPAAAAAAGGKPAVAARAPFDFDGIVQYFDAFNTVRDLIIDDPALARALARRGESDAAWAKRLGGVPAIRRALAQAGLTPAQYVRVGRGFYDAWMTYAGRTGPGPRPGTPDPAALAFVRANAGRIAQSMGLLMLPHDVAPWPGGPEEQRITAR